MRYKLGGKFNISLCRKDQSSRFDKAVSTLLAFSFTFILNGLNPLLSQAFVTEPARPANTQKEICPRHPAALPAKPMIQDDYATLIMDTDLRCISDTKWLVGTACQTRHNSPAVAMVDFEAELMAVQPAKPNCPDVVAKSANPALALHLQGIPVIAEDHDGWINPAQGIALVGPSRNQHKIITSDGAGLDRFLVCDLKADQNLQAGLRQNQEQFAFLTRLPGYLARSINGGLSKARLKPREMSHHAVVQFSLPSKPPKTLLPPVTGRAFEALGLKVSAIYSSLQKYNEKSPVMSNGPPAGKALCLISSLILNPSRVYSAHAKTILLAAGFKTVYPQAITGNISGGTAVYLFTHQSMQASLPNGPGALAFRISMSFNDINIQTTIMG